MKLKSYCSFVGAISFSTVATLALDSPARSQKPAFVCDSSEKVPATVVHSPNHGTVRIIEWKTTEFGDQFNPQTRCSLVSAKFQKYAQAGTLKYFTTGSVNRQPVICAVASKNAPCNKDSMLYTLKKGSNARETLKQLLNVRAGASNSALNETGTRIYVDFDEIVSAKAQSNANTISESESINESAPLF